MTSTPAPGWSSSSPAPRAASASAMRRARRRRRPPRRAARAARRGCSPRSPRSADRRGAASASVRRRPTSPTTTPSRALVERTPRASTAASTRVLHCAGRGDLRPDRGRPRAEDFASVVVRTNLLGAATVARHVVPVLRSQGDGDLVLVGSLLGHIAVPEMTPYVVSKWGVRALARQLRDRERRPARRAHQPRLPGQRRHPDLRQRARRRRQGSTRRRRRRSARSGPPRWSSTRSAPRAPACRPRWLNYAHDRGLPRSRRCSEDRLVGPAFDLVSRRRGKG